MSDWVKVRGDNKTMTTFCERCGRSVTFTLPISVSDVAAMAKAFVAEHRMCKERRMKYAYIAGPITGHADWNRPAFEAARPVVADILGLGRRFVTIPHDLFWPNWTGTEARAIERCLTHICCHVNDGHDLTVVLLPGWRDSLGTAVEIALARKLGVPVVELIGEELRETTSTAESGSLSGSVAAGSVTGPKPGTAGVRSPGRV